MSILDKVTARLGEIQQEMWRDRHPYLTAEPSGFSHKWVLKKGGWGCRPVRVPAAISMAKNPPPLPGAQLPPTAAAGAKEAPKSTQSVQVSADKNVVGQADSRTQQDEDCPPPPPFDMLELPDGMDAMGFVYAAHCARRWFNGPAHVIQDQSIANVSKAFVDDSSLKLSWVRKFGKVQQRYDHLLARGLGPGDKENIYNDAAKKKLIAIFEKFLAAPNHLYSGPLDTLAACGNDVQDLHQRFQFQLAGVSMLSVLGSASVVMNDLAASLANFNFYAAVASGKILTQRYNRYNSEPWQRCVHTTVEITHVYVYAKDTYSFNQRKGSSVSQYLGHWNRRGVIITPNALMAEQISNVSTFFEHERDNDPHFYLPPLWETLDKPVDIKSSLRKADVFYPVRNRDFERWRTLKGRGGDFLIFSNLERIKLPKPIVLDFGEKCWEYTR